ncbi:MAG: N-acetyltransferase [Candidatus Omnitrophota bacterium]|nr:N-acetyltransferase [Candidatus Omnitrophota bacterium]
MIRKARITDIRHIQALINNFAVQNLMLPRSLNELYESLRDFWVIEDKKRISGCAALHISWGNLAELRSLAVEKKRQGQGLGRNLVEACLNEAKELGAKEVFALTYKPKFFQKFGFKRVEHKDLPHKVWADCINCPKFPNCQEVALVKKI